MTADLTIQLSPATVELFSYREQLTSLRATLSQREVDVARLRATLSNFEARYFREVGVLYAELDDLEARIVEREVALYDSDAARERAEQARARAQESHAAAHADGIRQAEFQPAPALKTLFREVARRIHPDRARDSEEREHFTLLMSRANTAYRREDADALQRLLDDRLNLEADTASEGAELQRALRQIAQVKRDIALLAEEHEALLAGDIAQLHAESEVAALEFRDLLKELATKVRLQIQEANSRFEFIDRQIAAHGR